MSLDSPPHLHETPEPPNPLEGWRGFLRFQAMGLGTFIPAIAFICMPYRPCVYLAAAWYVLGISGLMGFGYRHTPDPTTRPLLAVFWLLLVGPALYGVARFAVGF